MAKFKVENTCMLIVDYEYDVEPGDVFKDPMKGWEIHVKTVLDAENVLVWREYGSDEKDKPLAERTKDLSVEKVQDLVKHYWGPLRGGEYKLNDKGAHETLGAEWVRPRFPIGARVRSAGIYEQYHERNRKEKPNLVALAPLEELIKEMVKPWVEQ